MALVASTLAACLPGGVAEQQPAGGGPTVVVSSPRPGQVVKAGETIQVTSTSTDPDGVQKVELWADGALARVDINPDVNSPYIVAQAWQSDRVGSHVFVVKAFDARGNVGQSEPVVITVEAESTATPMASVPTATASPLPPATVASPTVLPPTVATPATAVPPSPGVSPQPPTPPAMCTPPPCQPGEVYHCPQACPGGCGLQCATPTPTPTRPTFTPTEFQVHALLKLIWEKPDVKEALGYPSSAASDTPPARACSRAARSIMRAYRG